MAEEEASGALVPIFSPVRRRLAYYVVWSRKANSKVRNFVRWVVGEVGPAVIDDSNRPNLYVP
jgi:DNA-binding transcriptional LysR family regulator